jgi:hypothetical protein
MCTSTAPTAPSSVLHGITQGMIQNSTPAAGNARVSPVRSIVMAMIAKRQAQARQGLGGATAGTPTLGA